MQGAIGAAQGGRDGGAQVDKCVDLLMRGCVLCVSGQQAGGRGSRGSKKGEKEDSKTGGTGRCVVYMREREWVRMGTQQGVGGSMACRCTACRHPHRARPMWAAAGWCFGPPPSAGACGRRFTPCRRPCPPPRRTSGRSQPEIASVGVRSIKKGFKYVDQPDSMHLRVCTCVHPGQARAPGSAS